jgi:hypothetical protein
MWLSGRVCLRRWRCGFRRVGIAALVLEEPAATVSSSNIGGERFESADDAVARGEERDWIGAEKPAEGARREVLLQVRVGAGEGIGDLPGAKERVWLVVGQGVRVDCAGNVLAFPSEVAAYFVDGSFKVSSSSLVSAAARCEAAQ